MNNGIEKIFNLVDTLRNFILDDEQTLVIDKRYPIQWVKPYYLSQRNISNEVINIDETQSEGYILSINKDGKEQRGYGRTLQKAYDAALTGGHYGSVEKRLEAALNKI